jgi:hypothetical protein
MGKASVEYREVRFLFEPELTQVYVACEAGGDCPIGVQGWHHKVFPASTSAVDILNGIGKDSPILWPQEAPPALDPMRDTGPDRADGTRRVLTTVPGPTE